VRHAFVASHPDDAALSCGGLIASLHARGEQIALVSVYSGAGDLDALTPYQREALGFDDPGTAWAGRSLDPAAAMAARRAEDRAYAALVGAEQVFVNLPDAVFRGYVGDDELVGPPREDDPAPIDALASALAGVGPDLVYVPLSVGGHVDHRQVMRAAMALAATPGSNVRDRLRFYEDFPYTLTRGWEGLADLDPDVASRLPAGFELSPELFPIEGLLEAKLAGMHAYSSQVDHLFGGLDGLAEAVRTQAARPGGAQGVAASERYWRLVAIATP
jgi:LmbE family N-acetylglucosaminyl deacetylase